MEMGTTPKQRAAYFQAFPDIFISNRQAFDRRTATEMTPVPVTCQYCGAEILTWGFMGTEIDGQDNGVVWNPKPERCECYQSETYWRNVDRLTDIEKIAYELELRKKAEHDETNRLLKQSRLVDSFGGKTFDGFSLSNRSESIAKAKAKAESFANAFPKAEELGKGLLFTGPSGTGKTHLAAAAALEICKQHRAVIAIEAVELLSRIRSCYNRESREDEYRLMAIFTQVDLLFIDDLGKEKPSEWTLEKIFTLIDTRCRKKKPVIVTINYTDQELIDRLAGKNSRDEYELDIKTATAIVSRLHEMTWSVPMVASDYRGGM